MCVQMSVNFMLKTGSTTVPNEEKTQCAILFNKFKVPFNAISDAWTYACTPARTHTHTHTNGSNQMWNQL